MDRPMGTPITLSFLFTVNDWRRTVIGIQCHVQYVVRKRSKPHRITIMSLSRPDSCQNDSIGLAESPVSLILVEEPVSLMDAEFRGVGMEA